MREREKQQARIRALLGRTTARGFSEAEAMAAAEKAAELMREHAIGKAEALVDRQRAKTSAPGSPDRVHLRATIGDITNTAVMMSGSQIEFIGLEPGPQIACYLFDVTDRAINRAVREFKAGRYYRARRSLRTKREAVADMTRAMADSMARRLCTMFAGSRVDAARKLAVAARDSLYPDARTVAGRKGDLKHYEAFSAGRAAGEAVPLSRGVDAVRKPLMIGRGG